MKKKIICITIIGMFLLTSFSSFVDAMEVSNEKMDVSSENIDLKLIVWHLRLLYLFNPFTEEHEYVGYWAYVDIKNVGSSKLKKSDYPDLDMSLTAEFKGETVNNQLIRWWGHPDIGDSLEPGEKVGYTVFWKEYVTDFDGEKDEGFTPQGSTLKVFLDPENLIPESNDFSNNYWERVGIKSKSCFNSNPFSSLLFKFSFLQKIIEKINIHLFKFKINS